jgi:hypothetical protein
MLFAGGRQPQASELAGQWNGNFIFIEHPNVALLNYPQPPRVQVSFLSNALAIQLPDGSKLNAGAARLQDARLVGSDTLIGQWTSENLDPGTLNALWDYVEPYGSNFGLHYVLMKG